jgi:hypothetical protein
MVSILAGCETLSEVNTRLKSERKLANVCDWPRFADQSSLSRTLDALTLKQIEQLRTASEQTWQEFGQTPQHDWRSYLWLDFDLSGLPCGPQAEESQKGYFSDKKTQQDGNWLGSVLSITTKQSGLSCIQAIVTRFNAFNRLS